MRKVDLSIELQILAFHAQRQAVVRVALGEGAPVNGSSGVTQAMATRASRRRAAASGLCLPEGDDPLQPPAAEKAPRGKRRGSLRPSGEGRRCLKGVPKASEKYVSGNLR